jgi:AIPR protein
MNLRKFEPDDFNSFQSQINKIRNSVERTINLTWFYVSARFRIPEKEFKSIYSVDGSNDGGIDCYFQEGNTFYLIQSKYHERFQRESTHSINHELQKLEKTIIGENTNRDASDFINSLKRELENSNAYLEIIWLSTNEVTENVRKDSQSFLNKLIGNRKWKLSADINFIDRYALEGVIYDIKHGYVPHTGKKELTYEPGECMLINKDHNNIESVVCNVKATDILKWFKNSQEISKYLQKNVRESVGENTINKSIRESFKNDPSLFWYKHNGIIIFADWLEIDQDELKVTIRNPQIVNGAQTITQLYKAYDENRNQNNSAKLLVRVYRLPYEDSETYKRSIDIIAALNSQNKIKASDLHSTDPRQVMLENRINELGTQFRYFRKRNDQGRVSSWYNIFMTRLALYFNACHYKKPDEGIAGGIESYFEEDKRYNDTFPENLIKRPISNNTDHIVFKYIDCWYINFLTDRVFSRGLNKSHTELFRYIYWYLVADTYQQQIEWKEKHYNGTWHEWLDFLESAEYRNGILKYMKPRYVAYFSMLPKSEIDPRNFYKSTEGRNKFLKKSGNSKLFKRVVSTAYELFKKHNRYE